MTRAWWIEYKGALFAESTRGNEKQNIVVTENDRNLFLRPAAVLGEKFMMAQSLMVLMRQPLL